MKNQKTLLLTCLSFCLAIAVSFAQQAFLIHQDNVKPSKAGDYEKVAKKFHEACLEHKPDATWMAAMRDDFTYFYITPIENMAELDEQPMAEMAKAMGDEFGELFNAFDECYDSHGSYIMHSVDELSYKAPEGTDMSGRNYRVWYQLHYKPANAKKVKEGMKAVKAMFKEKGSKEYYNVYHSGLGSMDSYYLVSVAAKDEIDSATRAKANQEVLGPDRYETFNKLMAYLEKMEEYRGEMRPDLAYAPKE